MTTHSLKGILSKITSIQNQITLDKIRQASRSQAAFTDLQESVHAQITHLGEGIERVLIEDDLTAGDLAIRSRRGFQWLKFLSNPESLSAHLDALQRINLHLAGARRRKFRDMQVTLYHQGSLYKVQHDQGQRKLTAQESFISAPDSILNALIAVAVDPSSKDSRLALREYTFTKEYQQLRKRLEYLGVPPGSFAAGEIHHLNDSFQRVNREYFQGKLDRPHLAWSRRLTRRKFGHYQWDTDTVMISRTLDQEWVPEMAVDFVVYHELLHKKLGARRARTNRIAHTREFREAENLFAQAEEAKQLLDWIARKSA